MCYTCALTQLGDIKELQGTLFTMISFLFSSVTSHRFEVISTNVPSVCSLGFFSGFLTFCRNNYCKLQWLNDLCSSMCSVAICESCGLSWPSERDKNFLRGMFNNYFHLISFGKHKMSFKPRMISFRKCEDKDYLHVVPRLVVYVSLTLQVNL